MPYKRYNPFKDATFKGATQTTHHSPLRA